MNTIPGVIDTHEEERIHHEEKLIMLHLNKKRISMELKELIKDGVLQENSTIKDLLILLAA